MTRFAEPDALIRSAVALARRSAWHAKQSADLANDAEELLADAVKLEHERGSSAEASAASAFSGVAVHHNRTDEDAVPGRQRLTAAAASQNGAHGAQVVLIVDDDKFVTDTFATTLALEGYDVLTACTTAAAVGAAALRRPDLIFLDLHLPCTDGVSLLRELRSVPDHRATPVAVITGDYFLADEVTRELIELGAQLRFKPIWTEDLVALTHSLLPRPPA